MEPRTGSTRTDIFGFLVEMDSTRLAMRMGGSESLAGCDSLVGGCVQPGTYGKLGVAAASNIPGGRSEASTWTDESGHFWLFGGYGAAAAAVTDGAELNDFWEFNPSTNEWTWMGGSRNDYDEPGVYGELGVPAASNMPGDKDGASSWIDESGHLWLFSGDLANDLWVYQPAAVTRPAPTPTFSPVAGTVAKDQIVKIADKVTSGLIIYYTTNGEEPTTASPKYTSAGIEVTVSETIKAIAVATGYSESAVASAKYTIK
jgi:hypothetical protein